MKDRRAQAAHQPEQQRRVRKRSQVDDVFDEREARADCKAMDRCIDGKADATTGDEDDEEQGFQRFFGQRREVA